MIENDYSVIHEYQCIFYALLAFVDLSLLAYTLLGRSLVLFIVYVLGALGSCIAIRLKRDPFFTLWLLIDRALLGFISCMCTLVEVFVQWPQKYIVKISLEAVSQKFCTLAQ